MVWQGLIKAQCKMEAWTALWKYKGRYVSVGCGDHIVVLGGFGPVRLISELMWRKCWWPANPHRVCPFWSSAWTPAILLGYLSCGKTLQSSEGDLKALHTQAQMISYFFQGRGANSSAHMQTYISWEKRGIRNLCTPGNFYDFPQKKKCG